MTCITFCVPRVGCGSSSSTRRLTGSMIRAATRPGTPGELHLGLVAGAPSGQPAGGAGSCLRCAGVHCGDGWGTTLPGRQLLPPGRLQQLYLSGVCADPRCSISRDPRREECTICTAVAPDDAFTVRRYGDTRHDTASASAQPRHPPATNPQVSGLAPRSTQESGRSQVRRSATVLASTEDISQRFKSPGH